MAYVHVRIITGILYNYAITPAASNLCYQSLTYLLRPWTCQDHWWWFSYGTCFLNQALAHLLENSRGWHLSVYKVHQTKVTCTRLYDCDIVADSNIVLGYEPAGCLCPASPHHTSWSHSPPTAHGSPSHSWSCLLDRLTCWMVSKIQQQRNLPYIPRARFWALYSGTWTQQRLPLQY